MAVFWIIIAVIAVAVVAGAVAVNGLARRRKRMDAVWAEVEFELKHRHEVVASLLNTVLAIAPMKDGKADVVATVAQARRDAVIAGTTGDPARISFAENGLNACLRRFFEMTHDHPMLSSAVAFTSTRDELHASAARVLPLCEGFNEAAKGYDSAIGRFPRSLLAGAFGFGHVTQYRADEGEPANAATPSPTQTAESLAAAR
jgi:LemA protein